MIIIVIVIVILYLLIIGGFIIGFDRVKTFKPKDIATITKFSVVIPFRDEAENLPRLLQSIVNLNYPNHLFEIILVDDDSDDDSVKIIKKSLDTRFNNKNFTPIDVSIIRNERLTSSPKKDAITTAIKHTKFDWIITTDADCILPKYWLDSFDSFIQQTNSANCIVAPVTYFDDNTFLNRFQLLDLFSLQGATIGGFGINRPFLCNGANFAYTKTMFNTVEGFKGNTTIASGDDIFILEKITNSYPESVHYLKCEQAVVSTKSQPSWAQLISQRIRWAAKTGKYSWFGKLTGITVFLMNLAFVLLPILSALLMFNIKIWVYIMIIKLNLDFLLLYKTSAFFNQRQAFRSFLTSFFVYPFFSVYIAFLSLFKGYTWKERTFKR